MSSLPSADLRGGDMSTASSLVFKVRAPKDVQAGLEALGSVFGFRRQREGLLTFSEQGQGLVQRTLI